jgi:hypothetical protein
LTRPIPTELRIAFGSKIERVGFDRFKTCEIMDSNANLDSAVELYASSLVLVSLSEDRGDLISSMSLLHPDSLSLKNPNILSQR